MPRTADPATREKLVAAGVRLMLTKGYVATTVDDVCAAARLTKGAFFHYFEDKEALAQAAVASFADQGRRALESAPFHAERDPVRRALGFIDVMIAMCKSADPGGCLVGMFSQELADTHPGIRGTCAKIFEGWTEGFQHLLDEAKAARPDRATLDTRSLAVHFLAVLEGALLLDRAMRRREVVVESLTHYRRYVESLLAPRRPKTA